MKPKRSKMGFKMVLVERQEGAWETKIILVQRDKQWYSKFYKIPPSNSPLSNATLVYTYLKFGEYNYADRQIMWGCVEPSPVYSVLCQFPENKTRSTTIYDQ